MVSVKIFDGTCIPSTQMNLIFESRIIWRDFANWIRAYLISVYAGFDNQPAVEEKINAVILESSNILRIVFGEQIAEQYVQIASNFFNIIKSLVDAQKKGDTDAVDEYTKQLYENADQRAAFLAGINPFWQESEWKNFLYQFIQMTIDQSTTLLNKDYEKNIEVYDKILNLTSRMGDYYAQGILDYLTYSGKY